MPDRTQHSTPVEAVKTFQEFIDTAVTSGRWMAACWHIDADGKIILARTTYQFPTGDFEKAIKGLQERLLEETGAIPTLPGPLPTVQIHQGDDDAKVIDVGIDHPVEESRAPCNGEGGGCAGESIDDNAKVPAGAK